ncbi:regulator of G-protein signaling [Colletotrichum scovillei]|uniref:Regulator of G-protein signaling n=1 Tax=Colletotrichum scovillei TaxID=1209932 RepID=A0A9P7R5D6_9PEZI|nr:regulator of G-protein signaling [Colletotrichum scovillei]KAG7060341.1 regulator of G-protein signaling [Colletotrichum scovillei]KAG7067786.1 regulator of G-protein signaling [Colletotrichum scovillei]
MSRSRPTSGALMPGAVILTPPTLSEILSNTSTPPWTLAAFMAYLSQNHCLETLEFTMDADRYRKAYEQIITNQEWIGDGKEHVCSLWEKLMQAYIIPYAPREVNLPSPVRNHLTNLDCSSAPPPPSELDDAVRIVYELMNDSVLVPFIESVQPGHGDCRMAEDEGRPGRLRLRAEGAGARSEEPVKSPKFLPQLTLGRSGATSRSASASGEQAEREGLTDDSGSAVSPGTEPMTPPTTPPTSDWTFSTSPGGLQRALTAHNNGWKKEPEVMPSTTSTTPATSSSHLPLDGFSRVRHLFNPWEEPHPGKRLPLAASEAGSEIKKVAFAGPQHINNGGCKGGMAAKEFSAYHNPRPWMVRRPIRVRSRTNTPAPLRITTEISEDAKLKPISVHKMGIISPAAPTPAIPPAVPEDSGEPTGRGVCDEFTAKEVDASQLPLPASPPIDCRFTDFSNLLGINVHPPPEDEAVAMANDEPASYCHAAPDEDLYGWDAELERQSQQSSPILPYACDDDYQYRRTSMTKRSLLHRVFSMGGSPKDINIEVRRASSTSS